MSPLPFYVLDGQKLADKEKLAWIHQELEEDAGIETFYTTFLDIFADKVHDGDGTEEDGAAALVRAQ